ncbi:helix-turn-helix domain-containing protein [Sphingosinicella sp. BN140058]|uniref:helix-turn-helix domain-containing protein n=1 Tax=Sphingosinicella sp. BN140058 TaxID=1892855 RepID=UPI00101369D8|nr:helix-turn-helix domain-containing protein [Sphingosinicella sp. BN140058]QAY77465.1 helix-turn-helix domain-containing protein [Sphingosinicella sp. BN140058]
MDSVITAAARALAAGDPLGALNRVALRDDGPGLALRGIAMAQLGDFDRARRLLRQAGKLFGPREAVARARCIVAEAEIAFVSRDLGWQPKSLESAGAILARHGDRVNAAHARQLGARRLLLIGRLDEAEAALKEIDPSALPPARKAAQELALAELAIRRLRIGEARNAFARAAHAARDAGINSLLAEIAVAVQRLNAPAAQLVVRGAIRPILLDQVEELLSSNILILDACRHAVRQGGDMVSLARRPVLFALVRVLAEPWPEDVGRRVLLERGFGARFADESHRARLRVEIGRLRGALAGLAEIRATAAGFRLAPTASDRLMLLMPPVEGPHMAIAALLADGEAWSSSALAIALDASQRTVQRALEALAAAGRVQSFGHGRARRWIAPAITGFPTSLLLPAAIEPR